LPVADKILIKACLNGGRGREESPNVPWTPAEIAAEAQRCFDAGACVVHMHARTPDGATSQDAAWYAEADSLIRARMPLLTNHTTIRSLGEPVEVVLRHLREAPPDMCSLNMCHLISHRGRPGARTTALTPNGYEDIAAILQTCYVQGVFAETALFDLGFLNTALTLIRDGVLRHTNYFLLEFPSGAWGDGRAVAAGTPQNYILLREQVRQLYPEATCVSHGIGENVFRLATLAIAMEDVVRVGFEDGVRMPDGRLAESSAELVAWAVELARACGREPMTAAEARELLGRGGFTPGRAPEWA
jgi:3-keto-5-aminohexanoate cleavage enzyme